MFYNVPFTLEKKKKKKKMYWAIPSIHSPERTVDWSKGGTSVYLICPMGGKADTKFQFHQWRRLVGRSQVCSPTDDLSHCTNIATNQTVFSCIGNKLLGAYCSAFTFLCVESVLQA